jgi:hypothetical protein
MALLRQENALMPPGCAITRSFATGEYQCDGCGWTGSEFPNGCQKISEIANLQVPAIQNSKLFRIIADATFEAEDIDDAMLQMAHHFADVHLGVDSGVLKSGQIEVKPAADFKPE